MVLIDGKKVAGKIKSDIKIEVDKIRAEGGKIPHLAAVLVGDNPASHAYVASKVRSCEEVGFKSSLISLPENTSQEELLQVVHRLNQDKDVDGYIVQLPLPKHINEEAINLAIDFKKDVDGFHPVNFGRMAQGMDAYLPATPYGILLLLEAYQIPTQGKHAVVIGRSNIVGTPMSILLSRKGYPGDCTVTITHSRTQDLKSILLTADIVIAAIGIPNFVTADMIKNDAVIIDVGINRIKGENKKSKLVGDVDFENVSTKASFITPVPGGVGLMTVASLMLNTLKSAKNEIYA